MVLGFLANVLRGFFLNLPSYWLSLVAGRLLETFTSPWRTTQKGRNSATWCCWIDTTLNLKVSHQKMPSKTKQLGGRIYPYS